jgi:23S rRNA (uracil1939-C5)-methyltransferase
LIRNPGGKKSFRIHPKGVFQIKYHLIFKPEDNMAQKQQKVLRDPVLLNGIHSSGRCMAAVNGKNVFLEGGIPGETVTYTLERRNQGFKAGKTETVVHPSPMRTTPFCRHYENCGGCNWQHIRYESQLDLKHRILEQALEKYGIICPPIPPVVASPRLTHYRHRMEYAFSARARQEDSKDGIPALGFHKSTAPETVTAIRECSLQADPAREICDFIEKLTLRENIPFYDQVLQTGLLRSLSIRTGQAGNVMVTIGFAEAPTPEVLRLLSTTGCAFPEIKSLCYTIHLSPSHSQLQGPITPMPGYPDTIMENLNGLQFMVHASSFFQPNAGQAAHIFSTLQEWAGLTGIERVVDLYTGTGTIALHLAHSAGHVTGIEGSERAIADATENARLNRMSNTTFLTGDILHTFKPAFLDKHGKPGLIVLDPPRSGTLIEIKKTINASGAEKVIYLSCNPVSLAFDLKQLTEVYRVTRIQPFDMLPQTHHLETLVMLEK